MTLHARMATLVMGATALLGMPGCDTDSTALEDDFVGDLAFRCTTLGGCTGGGSGGTGGGLGNTSFLGHILAEGDVFPVDNLSLTGGTVNGVSIESIVADNCRMRSGQLTVGISEPNPTLQVDDMGRLLPKTLTVLTDPTTQCTVSGELWATSTWAIAYDDGVTEFETELRLEEVDTTSDVDGAPLYEFSVNSDQVPDDRSGWNHVCGYFDEGPQMAFKAFLMPGLQLGQGGAFTLDPDVVFLGCINGSIGKAWLWGYKSFLQAIGPEGHEVAHNVIRAEYCGDDVSHTETGTPIWLQSIFTDEGPDPNAPVDTDWRLEAVWSSDPEDKAICVSTTRLPGEQPPTGSSFSCPGDDPPVCTPAHLLDEDAVLASWAWTGN